MHSEIETLKTWITESDNIVFFGGAGVSTESGIPDFRSTDGLYHQKFDYPPETILSHTFFYQNPEYFFRFYREKMLPLDYQPNEAHKKLAAFEQAGKLRAIVTQNIDGLHQKAGSKAVFELHGSIYRNYCENAANSIRRNTSGIQTAFPAAPAAAGSSRTSFYMKKASTRG